MRREKKKRNRRKVVIFRAVSPKEMANQLSCILYLHGVGMFIVSSLIYWFNMLLCEILKKKEEKGEVGRGRRDGKKIGRKMEGNEVRKKVNKKKGMKQIIITARASSQYEPG